MNASPTSIFRLLHDVEHMHKWDGTVHSGRVIETLDAHSDMIHIIYKPVWIFPLWLKPRDICLLRYWRREEDGSYVICYQSTSHSNCKPTSKYIRARVWVRVDTNLH